MLLYIHVPFCVRKCGYCAFHSGPFSPRDAARYVDLVLREMTQWTLAHGSQQLQTIYIGGGTPSLLNARQLGRILDHAAQCFSLDREAEITLEANPDSALRPGFFSEIRGQGVNRLSLGVQSLQDALLRVLGRPHDRHQAILAMEQAAASFSNLSLDLIWGLPEQSLDQWMEDLAAVAAAGPRHLSLYGLTLEEGTPLQRAVCCGSLTLPDEERAAAMYSQAASWLEAQGFLHYEVSNFSRPGYESRHNTGYWAGEDYLGFGPAAVSTVQGVRWINPPSLGAYEELVLTGQGVRETEQLTVDIRRQEAIMLALRTRQGLDLNKFKAMAGQDMTWDQHPVVERLRSNGLVRLQSGHLQLTRAGLLVSNSIIELVLDLLDHPHDDTGHL